MSKHTNRAARNFPILKSQRVRFSFYPCPHRNLRCHRGTEGFSKIHCAADVGFGVLQRHGCADNDRTSGVLYGSCDLCSRLLSRCLPSGEQRKEQNRNCDQASLGGAHEFTSCRPGFDPRRSERGNCAESLLVFGLRRPSWIETRIRVLAHRKNRGCRAVSLGGAGQPTTTPSI